MKGISFFVVLTFFALVSALHTKPTTSPPHCTRLSKSTDIPSRFKFDYPTVYMVSGQQEIFQPLHCTSPPAVSEAETVVCDWAAPPLVQFGLEDNYVHVMRQDPSGRYAGAVTITTYQKCNHNIPPHMMLNKDTTKFPTVTKMS